MKKVSFFDAVVDKELAAGTLNLLRDSEGRAVMADLPDGTRLRWRQMVKSPQCDSLYGYSYLGNVTLVEDGINIKNTSSYNNGLQISTEYDFNGHRMFVDVVAKKISSSYSFRLNYGKNSIGSNDNNFVAQPALTTELKRFTYLFNCNMTNSRTIGFRCWDTDVEQLVRSLLIFDLTTLFQHCADKKPSSSADFQAMIHSEGTTELGYTPYTDTPIECVVKSGYIIKLTQT